MDNLNIDRLSPKLDTHYMLPKRCIQCRKIGYHAYTLIDKEAYYYACSDKCQHAWFQAKRDRDHLDRIEKI